MSFTIALGLVYQTRQMIPGLSLLALKAASIAMAMSVSHIALMVYISNTWVFPLPFEIVVSVIPFIAFFVSYLLQSAARCS